MEKMLKKQITLRIQPDLYDKLEKIAEQTGLTITTLLIVAIFSERSKAKALTAVITAFID